MGVHLVAGGHSVLRLPGWSEPERPGHDGAPPATPNGNHGHLAAGRTRRYIEAPTVRHRYRSRLSTAPLRRATNLLINAVCSS